MKHALLIILLGFAISCQSDKKSDASGISGKSDSDSVSARGTAGKFSDGNRMEVLPDTLYRGDTLKLQFKVPHATEFAIENPEGKFIYNFPKDSAKGGGDAFRNLDRLDIITTQTEAFEYGGKAREDKRIFVKPGIYRIRLGRLAGGGTSQSEEVDSVYYSDTPRRH